MTKYNTATQNATSSITCTNIGGGLMYDIPQEKIEYVDYFYATNGSELVADAYKRLTKFYGRAPDILFNAELFDFQTRKPASDVIDDGVVHRLTGVHGMGIIDKKKVVFTYNNLIKAANYLGGYPTLIRNGVKENVNPKDLLGSRGRTAWGVDTNSNRLFVALVPDGNNDLTLDELRDAFLRAGAANASNLDGGLSTQFYSPNGNHFTTRPVRGFVGIWFKVEEVKIVKKHKVFLSAGHGGSDSGGTGFGMKEKDINLQVLLGCKAELERHGVEVVTSRVTDEDDGTKEEVREANASMADIAMSFHVNAYIPNEADGCEFFIWNSNKEDRRLAELCEKYMKEIGQNSRGIKSGNHLYWCHYTNMTSVLAESFFIDNDKDNDIGDTVAEQKVIGVQYAKAALEYLGIEWIPPAKSEDEEKSEIVEVLYNAKILSDKSLWLSKIKTDTNCYWLMKKMADYIIT